MLNATAQQKLTQVLDIYCSHKHLLFFIFSSGNFNINTKMYLWHICWFIPLMPTNSPKFKTRIYRCCLLHVCYNQKIYWWHICNFTPLKHANWGFGFHTWDFCVTFLSQTSTENHDYQWTDYHRKQSNFIYLIFLKI